MCITVPTNEYGFYFVLFCFAVERQHDLQEKLTYLELQLPSSKGLLARWALDWGLETYVVQFPTGI